jgi:chromosome segregation ATPase
MNEPERIRCDEFSRILLGSSLKAASLEQLAEASASYQDFRVQAVAQASGKNELSQRIAARWRQTVVRTPPSDANSLLHTLEGLAQKQIELDRRMRESRAELLDKLKALDAFATAQASWRSSLQEMRQQIFELRKRLESVDNSPSNGAT